MRLRQVFAWLGLATVVLSTLITVAAFTVDFGFLRANIEARASQALGRPLSIDRLSIRLGYTSRIEARGLGLADVGGSGRPDLLSAERIDVEFDTLSLWRSALPVLRSIEAEGVRLQIVEDADGRFNWNVGAGGEGGEASSGLPFLLQNAHITGVELRVSSPRLTHPLDAWIETFQQQADDQGSVQMATKGHVREEPFDLNGTVGPWDRLLSGEDLRVELRGRLGLGDLVFEGQFDRLWAPRQPVLSLQVQSPSLSHLATTLGLGEWQDGAVSVEARTQRQGNRLSGSLSADAGGMHVEMTAEMDHVSDPSDLAIHADVEGPNLGNLLRLAGQPGWPERPFRMAADLRRNGPELEVDRLEVQLDEASLSARGRLPAWPSLAGAHLDLALAGPRLQDFSTAAGIGELPEGAFSLNGKVTAARGRTDVDLAFELAPGIGRVDGFLTGPKDYQLGLLLEGPDLAALKRLQGLAGLPSGPFRVDGSVTADSAQTRFDLDFTLPPGQGHVAGALQRNAGLNLVLDAEGSQASRLGPVFGIGGLPDSPWKLTLDVSQSTAEGWEVGALAFESGAAVLTASGLVGGGADLAGTQLRFNLAGHDFPGLLDIPGPVRLPAGELALGGRLAIIPGELKIDTLTLEAGDLDIRLDATLPWPVEYSHGSFRLNARGSDITQILTELAGVRLQTAAFSVRTSGEWDADGIQVEDSVLTLGEARLQAQGQVDRPPNASRTDLALLLHVPDLAQLPAVDASRWAGLPFDFAARLTGSPTDFELGELQVRLGDSSVRGKVRLGLDGTVPEFDIDLTAETLDLRPFQSDAPRQVKEPKPARQDRLIPDLPLPSERLRRANGAFSLGVDRLKLERWTFDNSLVRGQLRDGVLQVTEMGFDTAGERLSARLDATAPDRQGTEVRFSLHNKGLSLNFTDEPAERKREEPHFDIDLDLAARGSTTRELASSLDGSFIAFSPGGRVRNDGTLGESAHLLAQIISAISPQAALSDHIDIVCFAAAAKAHEGRVALDPGLVLQSSRLVTMAKGGIDLASEELDLGFNSHTSRLVDISASDLVSPYVRVGGTLASPSIQLDAKATLLSGGATVLSGGLSILAKKALDQLDQDPCGQILAQAGQKAPRP